MQTTIAELQQVFIDAFPARCDVASLEFVTIVPDKDDWVGVVIRLIIWDRNEAGEQTIRDIKEQQLGLRLVNVEGDLARFTHFVRALVRVTSQALAHPAVETLMPHDLIQFGALKLVKAHTEDDFARALSVKSRLGRYLVPVAQ